MQNDPTKSPLSYATPTASANRGRTQRIYYCIGLPLIGFGLAAGGRDGLFLGAVTAAGAFLLAMALPVQE